MSNIKLLTNHLKYLTVIASSNMCFNLIQNTKHKKTWHRQWLIILLVAFLVRAVATRKPEKVSIVTCAYFIFLKSEIWVSICNNWLSISPQELTPLCGTGRNWGHWEQVFTIWHAHSLKIPNYYLKPLLFWWWKEWIIWPIIYV